MKILLSQLKQLGDVLMTTPTLRAIKKKYPTAKIHYLTQKPADEIFINSPYVDKVITIAGKPSFKEILNLRKNLIAEQYDIAIDFLSSPRSALYLFISKIKLRIGLALSQRRYLYHKTLPRFSDSNYSALHKLKLLEKIDIIDSDWRLEFQNFGPQAPEIDIIQKKINKIINIGISVVSRRDYRRWSISNFAELITKISENYNSKFYIFSHSSEANIINELGAKLANIDHEIVLFNSLTAAWNFYSKLDFLIGNDNGPKHFAIAKGTVASLTLFARDNPNSWTPPNSTCHRWLKPNARPKSSCVFRKKELLYIDDIAVFQAYNLFKKMIEDFKWDIEIKKM